MSGNLQKMVDALFPVAEWRNNLAFFLHILASPVERTMSIVNEQQPSSVDPFRFMAFGFSTLTIVSVGAPLGDEKLELAVSIFRLIVIVSATIISLLISYRIFYPRSESGRTLDSFLVLSAIYAGVTWILSGANTIVLVFLGYSTAELIGLLVAIFSSIYGIRLYRRFWKLPIKKVLQYLVYAAVLTVIVLVVEVVVLSVILAVSL